MSVKKVAIIGAGSSGICAAKYARENDLVPTVFDKAPAFGGLWTSCSNKKAIYEGLYANCSYFCMQFSDFPHKDNCPSIFPSSKDIFTYLTDYINKFDLNNVFRFNTKVEKVKYLLNKKWEVHTHNLLNNKTSIEVFDFLIVSTGPHSVPRIPKFKQIENFQGLVLHSSQFKLNDERLKNKKCIVLGHSHSAVDISSQCVGIASNPVTNIFRRPYLVISRFLRFKSEINANTKNSFHVVPSDFISFRRSSTFSKTQTDQHYLNIINSEQTNKELSHPELYYDLNVEKELRESISDNYYGFVKSKHIKPKKGIIKCFEKDGIFLEDDHFEKADVIIICTGYSLAIDFFEQEILNQLDYNKNDHSHPYLLYKFTFSPYIENLAMICQSEGLYFTNAELQCKWASMIFSGKKALPSKNTMLNEINEIKRETKSNTDQTQRIDRVGVMDSIATELGVIPDFDKIKQHDHKLYDMIWNNQAISSIFLLNDKDKRDEALKTIEEVNYLMKREYFFDENDESNMPSPQLLAQKFAENTTHTVPLHLFKN